MTEHIFNDIKYVENMISTEIEKHLTNNHNLSIQDIMILEIIVNTDNVRQIDIAHKLQINKTNAMRSIDRLERCDFVKRNNLMTNRREKIVTTTPQGSNFFESCEQAQIEIQNNIIQKMGSENFKQLELVLKNIKTYQGDNQNG